MKKGSVPAFLQVIAVILFSFLLIVFTAQQIGSGLFAQKAIEKSSLIYTLSTAANALSVMDEGYITKELTQKYDILIGETLSEGKINYYVVVEPIEGLGSDDLIFSHEEGSCGSGGIPIITEEGGEIIIRGKLGLSDPCYRLEAELEIEGEELNMIIIPKRIKDRECQDCEGSVTYTGRIVNLSPGTYTVKVWSKYQFMDEPDALLGEEEVDIEYTPVDSGDEKKFYLLTTNVESTVIKNADCIRIAKTSGNPVSFEKCTKDAVDMYAMDFDWYKTQIYPGASGECGPTVVAMAIGWATSRDVNPSVIRDMLGYRYEESPQLKGSTTYEELVNALGMYDVDASIKPVSSDEDIADMIDDGSIVIIGQTMSHIAKAEGDWKENRIGRHHDYEGGHYIILRGVDSEYFIVYDPLSDPSMKYDNGDLAGKNRLYTRDEVWNALEERGRVIEVNK